MIYLNLLGNRLGAWEQDSAGCHLVVGAMAGNCSGSVAGARNSVFLFSVAWGSNSQMTRTGLLGARFLTGCVRGQPSHTPSNKRWISLLIADAGWRADIDPPTNKVAQFEFEVVIGADGRRNTLEGKECVAMWS